MHNFILSPLISLSFGLSPEMDSHNHDEANYEVVHCFSDRIMMMIIGLFSSHLSRLVFAHVRERQSESPLDRNLMMRVHEER